MSLAGNILITGGAGYLGRAIVRRAIANRWDCAFTIFSRDTMKHHAMQTEFPNCRYVIGDICDLNGLSKAFVGHDIVIHAAAQKHIPESERDVRETIRINVTGSDNVCRASIAAQVDKVIGISTDKACHPANVYGASKMLMERLFQEYDRMELTQFHLVRYGNVLSSTGSVLTVWQEMLKRDGFVTATMPNMTRFWMTVEQAVNAILLSLSELHGVITIPKIKALNMSLLAQYTMPGVEFRYSGLRPGEKLYEELLTAEEMPYSVHCDSHYQLWSATSYEVSGIADNHRSKRGADNIIDSYRSDNCEQLTPEELKEMLK
jgi:UDP-N-acetylglucosamine 4,6-dehydratase